MTCGVMKQNTCGRWQLRHLLLTTHRLCHLDEDNDFKRGIQISQMSALTKNSGAVDSDRHDFLVHVEGERDYLFYSKKREEIVKRIKSCYFVATGRNLPVYGVARKIARFMSTKQEMRPLPPESARLLAEDVFTPLTPEELAAVHEAPGEINASLQASMEEEERISEQQYGNWNRLHERPNGIRSQVNGVAAAEETKVTQPAVEENKAPTPKPATLEEHKGPPRKKPKVIAGAYEVLKEVGNGAYGKVIVCQHKESGHEVAIKVVSKDHVAKLDKIKHVFREKDLLYEMDH